MIYVASVFKMFWHLSDWKRFWKKKNKTGAWLFFTEVIDNSVMLHLTMADLGFLLNRIDSKALLLAV